MATATFLDLNGAGNLIDTSSGNWSGGGGTNGAPVAGDSVVIKQGYGNLSGDISTVSGGDFGTMVNVFISADPNGWRGASIGSAGSAVKIAASGVVAIQGGQNLTFVNIAAGSGNIASLKVINVPTLVLSSGNTITRAELYNIGQGLRATNITIPTWVCGGPGRWYWDVVGAAGATTTDMKIGVGTTVETVQSLGTACTNSVSGTFRPRSAAAATGKTVVKAGGRFNDQSTGTHPEIEVEDGGTYDPIGLTGSKTITLMRDWPNSKVIDKATSGVITITTRSPMARQ